MAFYGLRSTKALPLGRWKPTTRERRNGTPAIPTLTQSKSKHNFHIIQPEGRYRQEIDGRITAAGCRTRKDSTRFVDTIITASPSFFKGKSREEVKAYFERATDFLCRKIGKHNIVSAMVHMDKKRPICIWYLSRSPRIIVWRQRTYLATRPAFPNGRTISTPTW